jgi:hypothetical protein
MALANYVKNIILNVTGSEYGHNTVYLLGQAMLLLPNLQHLIIHGRGFLDARFLEFTHKFKSLTSLVFRAVSKIGSNERGNRPCPSNSKKSST